MNQFNSFLETYLGEAILDILSTVRAILIILNAVLIVLIVIVFIKSLKFRPRFSAFTKSGKKTLTLKKAVIQKGWEDLLKRSMSSPPQSLTLAIIDADSFVDKILKDDLRLVGEHMADRLEKLQARDLKTLQNLWKAHKLRNELVHNPDFILSEVDARRMIKQYEDFLKEIGAL